MMNAELQEQLRKWLVNNNAFVERSAYGRPQSQHVIALTASDLGTARTGGNTMEIGFPFRSVYVRSATDSGVQVSLVTHSKEDNQIASAIPLKLNDSVAFPEPISKAHLIWTAQTSKTMTLIFFVDAEFRSGQQISVSSGGVSVTWGDTVTEAMVALTAATTGTLLSADSNRKHAFCQNKTGGSLYVSSDSAVTDPLGAKEGHEISPNSIFEWKSTAALYGYSVAGGNVKTTNIT